ncbi:hypothetical protein BDR06DRAFT_959329 [Suillus hirtellus]|nr:hypothetical protein BDR06DRAFT_959329 [Suillus hirtellus]
MPWILANPARASTPSSIRPHLIVPDDGSPGLFGARTPRPPEIGPAPIGEPVHSWVTWHREYRVFIASLKKVN